MSRLKTNLFLDRHPGTFIKLSEAKFHYNYNIEAATEPDEQGNDVQGFRYNCLEVPYPLTSDNVIKELISALYPQPIEQKLQNDYIAANEGIEDESKKQAYLMFLSGRKEIKQMVESDCAQHGII